MKRKGQITIPTDVGYEEETKRVIERLGADAVRDCDGVSLPDNAGELADKVYNTYFVIRGDNEWANANLDELQHVFLMSNRFVATTATLTMDIMQGYFSQQLRPDFSTTDYWEVIDRTTNEVVKKWSCDQENNTVTIKSTSFHEYTVSFMALSVWDPVQMYNYITNNWTREKQLMYDPVYPKTNEYILRHMQKWCDEHKETNVVRFTTFLYQFSLVFNDKKKERYVDWFGYTMSVSPKMLDAFEAEYGYKLRAEDIIDEGYYNSTFRVPTKAYLDYIDFVQRYVTSRAKELVEITHKNGKEAMMFLGDCWIGAEPYGKYFGEIELDSVVGSVGGGVTVRMLSDIPHIKYSEGRFLPYFFPDTFFEGNEENATNELDRNWLTARRAMMVKPLDRIGYGGYLRLANMFPSFMDRMESICDEFRLLYDNVKGGAPFAHIKVAVLNAWGKLRSWQSHMVAHELWFQQIYSYQGVLESLSGLPVDVCFISFDDVIKNGIDKDINVIINVGDGGTAYSGGDYWKNEKLLTAIREWVFNGGGFIGVGEPTATQYNGKYFQLSDILGVDKEVGFSLSNDKYNIEKRPHFITEDIENTIDYGESMKNIYALENTKVLDIEFSDRFKRNVNVGEVKLATNDYGKGRGVYLAGLPFSFENARLLYKCMFFSAHKENELNKAYSSNKYVECYYYLEKKLYALINNTSETQTTAFYDINGNSQTITLSPMQIMWK